MQASLSGWLRLWGAMYLQGPGEVGVSLTLHQIISVQTQARLPNCGSQQKTQLQTTKPFQRKKGGNPTHLVSPKVIGNLQIPGLNSKPCFWDVQSDQSCSLSKGAKFQTDPLWMVLLRLAAGDPREPRRFKFSNLRALWEAAFLL